MAKTRPPPSIYTNGSSSRSVAPDQLMISFGVETTKKTAKESQEENASKVSAIKASVRELGLDDSEIKTSYFSVDAMKEDSGLPLLKITSFKTTHLLTLKVTDLEKGGDILDAITNAGANRIDRVSFTLKDETRNELQIQMLKLAAEDARHRAESIALGLKVKLGAPLSARDSFTFTPTRPREKYPSLTRGLALIAPPPTTEISGGEINLAATVTVRFGIK